MQIAGTAWDITRRLTHWFPRTISTVTLMKRLLLISAVCALYLVHQDFWFWQTARPLVFGFLPIGLFYHLVYTLAVAVLMWLLVKLAWPSHLEQAEDQSANLQSGGSQ
ncbi:MAG: hypothetical protein M3X11_02005 [Acidobacteriota bacterium]|nr:hypothetical protein [Acidobacteriota bacterium]